MPRLRNPKTRVEPLSYPPSSDFIVPWRGNSPCYAEYETFDKAHRDPSALATALNFCRGCEFKQPCEERAVEITRTKQPDLIGVFAGRWFGPIRSRNKSRDWIRVVGPVRYRQGSKALPARR